VEFLKKDEILGKCINVGLVSNGAILCREAAGNKLTIITF
jgi:hypothetical protein